VSRPRRPADVRPWRPANVNTGNSAANATGSNAGATKIPTSPISTKRDGDKADAASSTDTPANANSASPSKSRTKSGLKNHSDVILKIWKQLEVPVGHQLDFVCKYSDPLHAAKMEAAVNKLSETCTMIVTREFMLDLMRRLQKGERILSQEALEEEHEECLKAHNCFVSIVDDFGNTLFNRLGNMVRQLSEALKAEIELVQREYDETVTLRGTNYLQILEEQKPIEDAWTERPTMWRKVAMPKVVTYTANPFLRKMGEYVVKNE